jgi:transcriptional regulator with XRE-family HTH domain
MDTESHRVGISVANYLKFRIFGNVKSTLDDIARKCGVQRQQLQRWLKGRMSVARFQILCELEGVPLTEALTGAQQLAGMPELTIREIKYAIRLARAPEDLRQSVCAMLGEGEDDKP